MARRTKGLAVLLVGVLALLVGLGTVAVAAPYAGATSTSASTDTPSEGSTFLFTGVGFGPNEIVDNVLHSAPYALASATTDAAGTFSVEITLPAGVTGLHHIDSTGTTSGDTSSLAIDIVGSTTAPSTTSTSSGSSLPFTGADVVGMVTVAGARILGGGTFLALGRRRRNTV